VLRLTRTAGLLAILVALVGASGCHPAGPEDPSTVAWRLRPAAISDGEFAASLRDALLSRPEGDDDERRLLGVVAKQLEHADHRFERGDRGGGTRSVLGAFFLLSATDQQGGFLEGRSRRAIERAAESLSARGDVGPVAVLLGMLSRDASTDERARLQAELARVESFRRETLTGPPIVRIGDEERAAVRRALFAPSEVEEATRASSALIDAAIAGSQEAQQTGKRPSAEVADEIIRGLDATALSIVALHLRHQTFDRVIEAVRESSARLTLDPDFFSDLFQATTREDPRSLRKLMDSFEDGVRAKVAGTGLDADLLDGARFALLRELVRRDPSDLEATLALARQCVAIGAPEVVPLLLEKPLLGAAPRELAEALALVTDAAMRSSDADDHPTVLRLLDAAASVRKLGRDKASDPGVRRRVVDLERVAARELARAGRLVEAEAALGAATELAPDPTTLLRRGEIAKGLGATEAARSHGERAAEATDPAVSAEAHLFLAGLARTSDPTEARRRLDRAVEIAEKALRTTHGRRLSRLHALLGRALAGRGDRVASERAFADAIETAAGDPTLVEAAALEALASEWGLGDVEAMNRTLQRVVELAPASAGGLTYGALWVHYANLQAARPPSPDARSILRRAAESGGWRGALARFALGTESESTLTARVVSEVDRVEARFYVAMDRRSRGQDVSSERDALAGAKSAALFETRLCEGWSAP
jgi:tetratricopeptide (TPR) repeat protein